MICACGHPVHAAGHCPGGARACMCRVDGGIEGYRGTTTSAVVVDEPARPVLTTRRRARRGDPHTSQMAAETYTVSQLRRSQYDVYRLFSLFGPCHDEQLLVRAKEQGVLQSESGIRTRRHELVEAGLLRDSGARVTLDTGRESIVWAVNRPTT